ncbi:MAG: enoyl-CoA hydratase-related protein [Pseudomonadota bacterium]
MADLIDVVSQDGVTVITLMDPPVNALGGAMRQALATAFDTLPPDDTAVVLIGEGACFCGGVDLRELEPRTGVPSFADLMAQIEDTPRPVIAALHGAATGGGLELAQACHYRIAAQGTRLGQPEVTLGFPPGGGATQRLPRLIGVEPALTLMLSGQPIQDSRALGIGLIDARATGDLRSFAIQYARNVVAQGAPPRRSRDQREALRDGAANQQQITSFRTRVAQSPLNAPKRIIDCVEAALLLPFEAGIAFEQSAFEDCVASPQSEALRHAASADRRAIFLPEATETPPKQITRIALLGQGKRALDFAAMLLRAGLEVTLAGPSDMALPAHIQTWFDRAVAANRLNADQAARATERLRGPVPLEALSDVDLILDAAPSGATPYADLPADLDAPLAFAQDRPNFDAVPETRAAIALGFGIPAVTSDLVTLTKGPRTTPDALINMSYLARRLAKQTVICHDPAINLTARMLGIWKLAADTCLRDGATPAQVDKALRALGCPRGPYQLLDMAGLGSAAARVQPHQPARQPMPDLIAALRDMGHAGRRAGQGVYLYDAEHPHGREDPEVATLCAQLRQEEGLPERQISDGAIQRRCLIALANEAARLRMNDAVKRATDLDVVMMHGLGFPRWRGGPVLMADQTGLLAMRRDLERLAAHDPFIWEPAPLLSDLIKNGARLSEA